MNLSVANWPPLPPSIHQQEICIRPKIIKEIFFTSIFSALSIYLGTITTNLVSWSNGDSLCGQEWMLCTPHFCYRIVVFNKPGVFIIVSVPICIYKNVTKYLKIICMGDFFIFTNFLMGRWWLLCTALCSSKLRFGYQ